MSTTLAPVQSKVVRRLQMGNVSTQPFALEPESVQEKRKQAFHQDLRDVVNGRGSITETAENQNEQFCFEVSPFANVSLPISEVTRRLCTVSWPDASVTLQNNRLLCTLPYAKRARLDRKRLLFQSLPQLLWHLGNLAAGAALLYFLPRDLCVA